jgi:hypothetical protein
MLPDGWDESGRASGSRRFLATFLAQSVPGAFATRSIPVQVLPPKRDAKRREGRSSRGALMNPRDVRSATTCAWRSDDQRCDSSALRIHSVAPGRPSLGRHSNASKEPISARASSSSRRQRGVWCTEEAVVLVPKRATNARCHHLGREKCLMRNARESMIKLVNQYLHCGAEEIRTPGLFRAREFSQITSRQFQ